MNGWLKSLFRYCCRRFSHLTMLGHPFCPCVNVCAFLNKPRLFSLTQRLQLTEHLQMYLRTLDNAARKLTDTCPFYVYTLNKKFEMKFERISLPDRGIEPAISWSKVWCSTNRATEALVIWMRKLVVYILQCWRESCKQWHTVVRRCLKTARNKFLLFICLFFRTNFTYFHAIMAITSLLSYIVHFEFFKA